MRFCTHEYMHAWRVVGSIGRLDGWTNAVTDDAARGGRGGGSKAVHIRLPLLPHKR